MATKTTTKIIVWFLVLLRLSAYSCPDKCRCLPDPHRPEDLKIRCSWNIISGKLFPFSSFPTGNTRTLKISCSDVGKSELTAGLFSDFSRLRHLELTGCGPKNGYMSANLFRGLHQLRTLTLDNLGSRRLQFDTETVRNLKKMERLSLTDSKVVDLPRGIFCSLLDLKMLNFSGNSFTSLAQIGLSNDICSNHLVLVDLSRNRITKLQPNDFSPLPSLRVLDLSQNKIQTIDSGSFVQAPNLQELFLENNRLIEIKDLPSVLRFLDLSRNHLSIIPRSLSQLSNLIRLNISHNRLDSSTPFLVQSRKLKVLDLSHNSFGIVPVRMFRNLTSLTLLNMQQNRIEKVEETVFASLKNLRELDLSDNRLTVLTQTQMEGLESLSMLRLDKNLLTNFSTDAFDGAPKIEQLYLANNLLLQVPTCLPKLYHLKILDLSRNKISEILKFLFSKLPNLRSLDLSRNNLGKVERYFFEDVQNLEEIDLSSNNIQSIEPFCFEFCPNLQSIRLDDNLISQTRGVFDSLTQLRRLNLTQNQLMDFDLATQPTGLRTLELGQNRIAKLTNSKPDRVLSLTHLHLSFNKLFHLAKDVIPDSLIMGNFSHNRLNSVESHTFYQKLSLLSLDLSHNQFEQLNISSVQMANNPEAVNRHLFLSNNPFQCSCVLDWLKKLQTTMETSQIKVGDFGKVQCRHILNGKIRPIVQVQSSQFLCPYTEICSNDCLCCDFDSCDCKNVCPTGCDCYHDSVFWSNIIHCRRRSEPINPMQLPMYATEIYLDGTNITQLKPHAFLGRFRLKQLFLNNTGLKEIGPQTFNGLTNIEILDLSDNELTEIRGDEFHNTPKLLHLFLNGNNLERLGENAFDSLPSLQSVTLHNNRFTKLPQAVLHASPSLYGLSLAGNPFRCDCDSRFLIQKWLPDPQNVGKIHDLNSVVCVENLTSAFLNNDTTILSVLPPTDGDLVKVNFWTFRTELNQSLCRSPNEMVPTSYPEGLQPRIDEADRLSRIYIIISIACLIVFGVLLLFIFCTIYCRKRLFQKRYKSPPSLNSSQTTTTPVPLIHYDIFVSYHHTDQNVQKITSKLESEAPYYQLCMLYEDLGLNAYQKYERVEDPIIQAMQRSQYIILFLTKNFLENEWEKVHIRLAHQQIAKDKTKPRIVIYSDDVDLEKVDNELGIYLRSSYRLKISEAMLRNKDMFQNMFWQHLMEILPNTRLDDTFGTTSTHYSDLYDPTIDTRNFVKTGYV